MSESDVKWSYPTYLEAKVAAIRRQTSPGHRFPVCPVCGGAAVAGHAHHVWLSQRFKLAHNDLRNLVIVCNESAANCHQRAHGEAKTKVEDYLLGLLGDGNVIAGAQVLTDARREWLRHGRDE